jgi:flagellar hook protein FlgE
VGLTAAGAPAAGAGANANPDPEITGMPAFTVNFDNNGMIRSVAPGENAAAPAVPVAQGNPVTINVAYNVPNTNPGAGGAVVRQNFTLDLGASGTTARALTQFASSSSSKAVSQDGHGMGYLENFKIDQSGTITGVYTNGTNRTLGQVALASFTNQGGLEKEGETNFVVSNNSGVANVGPSGSAGKGKIIAGTLEMSNVDLAEQFVDMIVTQRGFQANSRTIQTADQLLQEILSLKR